MNLNEARNCQPCFFENNSEFMWNGTNGTDTSGIFSGSGHMQPWLKGRNQPVKQAPLVTDPAGALNLDQDVVLQILWLRRP